MKLPSIEYLKECFTPKFRRGVLVWKRRPKHHFSRTHTWNVWNYTYPGSIAGGYRPDGYLTVAMRGRKYLIHRILFAMYHDNSNINSQLDHIDGNPSNNAISNLRKCSNAQNQWNWTTAKTSASGVRNVQKTRQGTYEVVIKHNKKSKYFGAYETLVEAKEVAENARKKLHGKFISSNY